MTGPELKQLRQDLGEAIGRPLSAADMAKLCGLEPKEGADTIRRWEVTGPSGPADKLLGILAMASDRYPILDNFNIFDRWDVNEKERPARRGRLPRKNVQRDPRNASPDPPDRAAGRCRSAAALSTAQWPLNRAFARLSACAASPVAKHFGASIGFGGGGNEWRRRWL